MGSKYLFIAITPIAADSNARSDVPLIDRNNRVVGVCLAPPGADTPGQGANYRHAVRVVTQNCRVMRIAHPELFPDPPPFQRRGQYHSVHGGISMGGGQRVCLSF